MFELKLKGSDGEQEDTKIMVFFSLARHQRDIIKVVLREWRRRRKRR